MTSLHIFGEHGGERAGEHASQPPAMKDDGHASPLLTLGIAGHDDSPAILDVPAHETVFNDDTAQTDGVWELPIGYALGAVALVSAARWGLVHGALIGTGPDPQSSTLWWPLNGLITGLLLGRRGRDRFLVLLSVAIAMTIDCGLRGSPWTVALATSLLSVAECAAIATFLPPFRDLQQWLGERTLMQRLVLGGMVAAPAISAGIWAARAILLDHASWWNVFEPRAAADALGILTTLPLVLVVRSWWAQEPFTRRLEVSPELLRSLLMITGATALTATILLHPFPALRFVLFPAVLLTVYLGGLGAAAVAVEAMCGTALYAARNATQTSASDLFQLQCLLGLLALTTFFAAVVRNERRRFAATLESSERHCQLLAECSRDVILLTDLSGVCQVVSPASVEVLGYKPEDLNGTWFVGSVHPDDRAACMGAMQDICLSLEREVCLTFRAPSGPKKSDKQVLWLEARLRAALDELSDVSGVMITLRDVSEQKRLELELSETTRRLEDQASFDALTSVANRRRFDAIFEQEWRRGAREFQPLALLLIEVDHLERIREEQGRPAADTCLRTLAETLTTHARRPGDLVARYDGEEFAVILPATDLVGSCELAERIRRIVEELRILVDQEQSGDAASSGIAVTLSIGAAAMVPAAETSFLSLIEEAGRALLLAKANGRNRVEAKPGPRPVRRAAVTRIHFASS